MNRLHAILFCLLALSQALSAIACRELQPADEQAGSCIKAGGSEVLARVYDAKLGRFLSADPAIQDPDNLQCYNRYSYCANNPLVFADPTGYVAMNFMSSGSSDWKSADKIPVFGTRGGYYSIAAHGDKNGGIFSSRNSTQSMKVSSMAHAIQNDVAFHPGQPVRPLFAGPDVGIILRL